MYTSKEDLQNGVSLGPCQPGPPLLISVTFVVFPGWPACFQRERPGLGAGGTTFSPVDSVLFPAGLRLSTPGCRPQPWLRKPRGGRLRAWDAQGGSPEGDPSGQAPGAAGAMGSRLLSGNSCP